MVATFQECFNIILAGDQEASRKAARQVRKLVYGSGERESFKLLVSIVENAPKEYAKIKEDWRQENFVMAISVMYFLHNKESQPDFLFPWLYDLIQHPKGNIRYAAVRMFENELGPLTVHLRCPDNRSFSHRAEQSNVILAGLYFNLAELSARLWQPSYKKYKYISSLPTGPYKSVQMVFAMMQEDCGEDYVSRLADFYHKKYFSNFNQKYENTN